MIRNVKTKYIRIWTDGSCNNDKTHKTGGYGGYAYTVEYKSKTIHEFLDYEKNTNSSRMEMMAVLEALKYVDRSDKRNFKICSDSAFIVNTFHNDWYLGWIERDFSGTKNDDIWREIFKYYFKNKDKVLFKKVKGHSGLEFNERVDFLANEARKFIIEND